MKAATQPPAQDRGLEQLIESISDHAIYMLDPDGRVVTWNSGAQRLKGYAREEIEGQPFARFFSVEDRRAGVPEQLLAEAAEKGKVETEGWRVRKDGGRFWAQGALHAVRAENGALVGFAKITRDMTADRAARDALIESERRFRLMVENVIDYAIFMLDVNGTVANWNAGAQRIKGYTADEVVGSHFSRFYTPEDRRAGLPARALETARTEGRFEAEGWRLRKDGGRFWALVVIDPIWDEERRLIGFAKITRDISQRKAAEDALAESERQFRMLVAGVVDYALYMLDPNGVISSWNAGAEHIKGYQADDIVGQHFSRFYTEADRAAGVPARALQTAGEQGRYEAEGWRVRKDGSLFWASVVIDAIRDEDGRLVGFAKITRDVTEKRNAQLELQRAHDQLAQAQKMEALGKLTGGVAHDFNNLLMVVSGQAQMLRNRVGDDPRALRALDAIETSAKRGEDLTRHLLAFSRRQRLQPVPVALADRVEDLKDLIAASLPPTVRLVIDLSSELWPVKVDPSELELSLLNLAVNARDAMPGGGVLAITAENVKLTRSAGQTLAGDFVAVTVSDTGVGIPDDILPRIFDPFFTTKEVSKGTGLGLSQVYGFAQQSGGEVQVRSELGRGTSFTFYLPRTSAKVARPVEEAAEPVARSARILVVEDNPEVAEVAAAMLEQLGHTVRVVGGAAAAMSALHEHETPDLVFSDIVMAGEIDGLGLARRVREEAPSVPVLLATGYSQAAEQLGDEFPILRKPYKLGELSRAVGVLLARSQAADDKLISLQSARRARQARRDGDPPPRS
ncbi:FOG: PAS/PAC domain protein [Phenylobacterium zucineum HLK1]|uniref:histidine kinase n=1 Tax=Phenylobacterium zucineum (strain HLK1) TaxID=450851 RepID=B4RHM7_PHEZH|nr:PAS domain S-box protein [Phenylobacterium zucineum]ACG79068.1 FOG: PAS/PAC domain protein [Phenylobacterium zucineum HLK1]